MEQRKATPLTLQELIILVSDEFALLYLALVGKATIKRNSLMLQRSVSLNEAGIR